MKKDNIELPPLHYDELPEPDDPIPAMHNYARRAIKADRQRRSEPVEYQYRTRADWLPGNWTDWERCTAGSAADYERVPLLHDWHYQVRRLYTAPQPIEPPSELMRLMPVALANALRFAEHVKKCLRKNGEYAPLITQDVDEVISALTAIIAQREKKE